MAKKSPQEPLDVAVQNVPLEHLDEVVLVGPTENLEALQVADVRLLVLSERYGPLSENMPKLLHVSIVASRYKVKSFSCGCLGHSRDYGHPGES